MKGPVCGNGSLEGDERCDDSNTAPADGCSAVCEVESGWICRIPGGACSPVNCGNGALDEGEACDDANTAAGDGCGVACALEPGWTCSADGRRCAATACGDGLVAGREECDDADETSGDGCSQDCRLEPGFKCPVPGAACETTSCGDARAEGTEECDDGNNDTGDGCSPFCKREPVCSNGQCTAVCGDGLLLPGDTSEECDDGNQRPNDGCSPTCRVEPGFSCEVVVEAPSEVIDIPVVYRDFRGHDLPGGHIDFQNRTGSEKGIVQVELNAKGKPAYAKTAETSSSTHGAEAFAQWYLDEAQMNRTVLGTLRLERQAGGQYLFSNTVFFPLDQAGFVAEGTEPLRTANDDRPHNFHFTSEARYWFEYKGTEQLTFFGDDDLWVFVNRRLALDLGGAHPAETGFVDLAAQADALGLVVGGIYEVAVFHAERHTTASSYQLTLNDFESRRSECKSQCGDGIVQSAGGESCDDGNLDSGDGCSSVCQVEIG